MSDDVEVKLGADVSDAQNAMQAAQASITASLRGIGDSLKNFGASSKETADATTEHHAKMANSFAGLHETVRFHLEGIGGLFETLRTSMLGLGVAVAGGVVFKESIDSAVKLTEEVRHLSQSFGMTANDATQMALALKLIGKDSNDYIDMAMKLQRQMKTNSDAIEQMGLQLKDQHGDLRPLNDIMLDAVKVLDEYKEGTDRNSAALYLFGRSAKEVYDYQLLTNERLARAKELQEAYGIEMGPKAQAEVIAYKQAQAELGIAFEAVEHKIGEAVMPTLKGLAEWLNSNGPTAVSYFGTALKVLETAFLELQMVVKQVVTYWIGGWSAVIDVFSAVGKATKDFVHGDYNEAVADIKSGYQQVVNDTKATVDQINALWDETGDKIGGLWGDKQKDVSKPKPPGKDFHAPKKNDSQVSIWEAQLAAQRDAYDKMKLEEGSFEQFSKQMESDFWQSKISLTEDGSKERAEVEKKYYEVERGLRTAAFAEVIAGLELQKAQYKGNYDAIIAIEQQEYDLEVQHWGAKSAQADAALKKIAESKKREAEQAKQVADIQTKADEARAAHAFDMEQLAVKQQLALQQISKAQSLEIEQQFEDKKSAIQKKALEDQRALVNPKDDPVQYAKITAELEKIEEDHQKKILDLRNQTILESNKYQLQATDAMRSSFDSLITDFEKGNKSLRDLIRSWSDSLVEAINKIVAAQLSEQYLGAGTSGGGALSSIAGSLFGGGGASVPFYDVGTSYVPQDQLAMVHKGEAVIPAAMNKGGYGGNVTINFANNSNTPMDTRTQQQVAAAIGLQMQKALRRNT